LLEGKNVNLRVLEKEDLDFYLDFWNNVRLYGPYESILPQMSRVELEKRFFEASDPLSAVTERARFIVEKKDGTKIGGIDHYLVQPYGVMEIGYSLIPSERGKGYGSEMVQMMVDYLFLSRDIARIQASTDVRNKESQRILEKAGFKREGTLRKLSTTRGESTDEYIYSILREEWKEPRTLTKTTVRSQKVK
jgi:RimJ/RimL family protein N-acetyltransferase